MSARKLTVRDVRRAAAAHGGRLERDGCGGWEVLAPDRTRWKAAEVWCYVLPLNECASAEERQDLLRGAVAMLAEGAEAIS